jgi:hypothetical protein
MRIASVDVTNDSGVIESHPDAAGHQLGPNGELIVLGKFTTLNDQGRLEAQAYPAITYASGTWRKVEIVGVKGDVVAVPADVGQITKLNSKKAK